MTRLASRKALWTGKQRLLSLVPSSFKADHYHVIESSHDEDQDYLLGVRGCLAIMSFLWAFLQTFAPSTVAFSSNETGPPWQLALRKSLSVLFWNGSLIYSSIIFLSARMICIPFLLKPNKTTLASSVFRRGIRLWIPSAVALIVVYVVFSRSLGSDYLEEFASKTSNTAMPADIYLLPNSLTNFNAIFDLFWVTHTFTYQAANWAFPTQTLWIVSALFQQSYTVYATMVVIPFTRKSWRLWGAAVFILTAWWVYSWAWFSVTGLLFADLVMSMDLRAKAARHRLWVLLLSGLCLFGGYFMMFYWVAVRPDLQFAEINYHTGIYNTGGIYNWNNTGADLLMATNYLVIVGFFILLETTPMIRSLFRNRVFMFLGDRSFSYFLLQSTIIYTLGIKTVLSSISTDLDNYAKASGVALITTLIVTLAAGEVLHHLIDRPSRKLGHILFAWIRE